MSIKEMMQKVILGPKRCSADYVEYLRSLGMVIGKNTVIYSPRDCTIDETRPWMVELGDNVSITKGVTILTHGYDWSVFKGMYGDVLGSAGRVKIGNNVFIGMNSTILKGVTVGDNVVIGANSLINKDVPSNSVVVGNPQRVVCSIDEYLEKRRAAQLDEVRDLYKCWRKNSPEGKRGGVPPRELFSEFFWLFEPRGQEGLSCDAFEGTMRLRGTEAMSYERFMQVDSLFESYEMFINYLDTAL